MAPQQRKQILFVDDEDSIRLTLSLVLQQRGYDVEVAASVREAIGKITSNRFDVLLSDLNIGEAGDGFAVVRAIREVNSGCVTIILTGVPWFRNCRRGHPTRERQPRETRRHRLSSRYRRAKARRAQCEVNSLA